MAVSKEESTVSYPLVLGTTSLPKKPLSYRWVITEAKSFLAGLDKDGLKSPVFSITPPPTIDSQQTLSWHLLIKKEGNKLVAYLHKEELINSKVTISDCKIAVANSKMTEMITKIAPDSQSQAVKFDDIFQLENIDEHLFNGTLTIQVNATLCFHSPTEKVYETQKLPPENPAITAMKSLLEDKLFTDVTIMCGDKEFKVHKAVLASQSPVFKKMFVSDMKEKQTSLVEISDINPAVLSDMVAYLYTGTAPNIHTLAKDLLAVADKYELTPLFNQCENTLNSEIKISNAVDLFLLADLHNAAYLKKNCLHFIYQNLSEISLTSQWKQLKQTSKQCEERASLLMEVLQLR